MGVLLKKSVACVLGLVTFLFGLLVVLPAGLMFILVWVLMNCLILVFNKGREATAWLSGGTVTVDGPGYLELSVSDEWPVEF